MLRALRIKATVRVDVGLSCMLKRWVKTAHFVGDGLCKLEDDDGTMGNLDGEVRTDCSRGAEMLNLYRRSDHFHHDINTASWQFIEVLRPTAESRC